jgi:hypothetical protein
VLAFAPRESDLPLQVAFPILLANLTGELFGGTAAPTTAVKPGDPVVLAIPSGATGLHVVAPDGRAVDLVPGAAAGTSVTYTQTDQLGVYVATPIAAATPSGSPGAPAGVSPSPAATPSGSTNSSGSAAPSGDLGQGADPTAPIRFAVDLFDVDESAIAPGSAQALEQLGRTAAASGTPGASGATGAADPAAGRPNARDELWIPIVLLILVVLCVEWSLYHRDAVLRGWRGLTGRLRGSERSRT